MKDVRYDLDIKLWSSIREMMTHLVSHIQKEKVSDAMDHDDIINDIKGECRNEYE